MNLDSLTALSRLLVAELGQACVVSSAMLILLLLLRRPWLRVLGASHLPLLWWLLPISVIAVWLPAPSAAVAVLPPLVGPVLPLSGSAPKLATGLAAELLLAVIWLLGALCSAAYFGIQQRRFVRALQPLQRHDHYWSAASVTVGPALIGLLQPRIVLPADFRQRFDTEQQSLILAHEHSHLQRGDIWSAAAFCLLRVLLWFNPLLHWAVGRLRHDQEMASDAAVQQQFPRSRKRYAQTLLDVQLAVPGLPVGCLWQSSHPLKERIAMLQRNPVSLRLNKAAVVLAVGLLAGVGGLAWAAQPAATPVAKGNDSEPSYQRLIQPSYPKSAASAGIVGQVVLKVLVGRDGRSQQIEVSRSAGDVALDSAAENAVRQWTFNPATRGGQAVEAWVQVPVCFAMDEHAQCDVPADALDSIQTRPQG